MVLGDFGKTVPSLSVSHYLVPTDEPLGLWALRVLWYIRTTECWGWYYMGYWNGIQCWYMLMNFLHYPLKFCSFVSLLFSSSLPVEIPCILWQMRMRFPFLTGTELMLGNMSSCNASRDNVSGLDELNFAWDPWEALWGVSWPNALNALDTVAFQFSVTGLSPFRESQMSQRERTGWTGWSMWLRVSDWNFGILWGVLRLLILHSLQTLRCIQP